MAELLQKEEATIEKAKKEGIELKRTRTEGDFIRKSDKGWDVMNRIVAFSMSIISLTWLIVAGFNPHIQAPWYKLLIIMLGMLLMSPAVTMLQHRSYNKGIKNEIDLLEKEMEAKLAEERQRAEIERRKVVEWEWHVAKLRSTQKIIL